MMTFATTLRTPGAIAAEEAVLAHNYHPLPVVIASADGAWVTDVDGRRYLDGLAAYSAVNFGHRHPALIAAARAQLDRATLVSRAFHSDVLGPFAAALTDLLGYDMMLPMNTGAEAVESAVKVARAWGHRVKGVAPGRATIIVADGQNAQIVVVFTVAFGKGAYQVVLAFIDVLILVNQDVTITA